MVDPWHALADRAGDAVSAKIGGTAVQLLMVHVLKLRDPSSELLETVSSSVEALREGPFHAGVRHLEEGTAAHRSAAARRRSVEKARDRFIDANATLRSDAAWRSLTALHIAVCSLALGDLEAARRELREAHEAAVERLEDISPESETPAYLRNLASAMVVGTATFGLANALAEKRSLAQARRKLIGYGRYVLALREVRRALGEEEDALPEHVLVRWEQFPSRTIVVAARRVEKGRVRFKESESPISPLPVWRLDGSPFGKETGEKGRLVRRWDRKPGPPFEP